MQTELATFAAVVRGTGFFGFGLSVTGSMIGADITIVRIGDNGEPEAGDYFSKQFVQPVKDTQQDVALLEFDRNATHTRAMWRRPLLTCDDADFEISVQPIFGIFAVGATDELEYHGATHRTTSQLQLLLTLLPTAAPVDPSDHQTFVGQVCGSLSLTAHARCSSGCRTLKCRQRTRTTSARIR